MEIFYEISSIDMTVRGTTQNKKGETIQDTHRLESFVDLLKSVKSGHKNFKDSVKSLTPKISKRYQSVGIEKVHYHEDKKTSTKYYHFALHYVLREKRDVRFTNIKDQYVVRKVETKDGEFQSNYLHFTVIPEFKTVILDRRCNSGPTEEFLRQVFLEHLDPNDYGLAHAGELVSATKLKIKQELVKDYQKILKENFSKLRTMTFTLAKPLSERTKKEKNKQDGEDAMKMAKGFLQKVMGDDAATKSLLDSPLKSIQVSLTLDTSYDNAELKKFRKAAKDGILECVKNDFLTASNLEFKDEESNEITRAILRGMGKNHRFDLDVKQMEDDNHIWNLHRTIFQEELKG